MPTVKQLRVVARELKIHNYGSMRKAELERAISGHSIRSIPKTTSDCPPGKIVNPRTGKCVSMSGKIGKSIIEQSQSASVRMSTPPKRKAPTPPKRKAPTKERLVPVFELPGKITDERVARIQSQFDLYSIGPFMYYLHKKYKNLCVGPSVMWDCETGVNKVDFASFDRCIQSKERFVIMHLSLHCPGEISHANVLIYDSKTGTLERFDPTGSESITGSLPKIDSDLEATFHGKITEYIAPLGFCPMKSFQTIEMEEFDEDESIWAGDPIGFCLNWTMWYIHLRMANPNIPRNQVIQKALDELGSKSFKNFIRNYTNIAAGYVEEIYPEYEEQSS
jgi:hypothetical protein